jgi:hypothetical protein
MLLVASALIGFCMFSAEGFTGITFVSTDATCVGTQSTDSSDCAINTNWVSGSRTLTDCDTSDGCAYTASSGGAAVVGTTGSVTIPVTGNTITGTDASVYTFTPGAFVLDTGAPTCGDNKVMGTINRGSVAGDLDAANINSVFPCHDKEKCIRATATQKAMCPATKRAKTGNSSYCAGEACADTDFNGANAVCCETPPGTTCPPKKTVTDGAAAIKTQNGTCGNYKKYKTTGTTFTGVAGITSPTYLENCCEDNCTTDKCDTSNLFWLLCWFNNCEACKDGENEDSNCSDPDLDYVGTYLVGGTATLLAIVAFFAVGAKIISLFSKSG